MSVSGLPARWLEVQAARVTASDKGGGISEVRREPVEVMFLEVADTQTGITEGWQRLEGLLGDLRGRRFFGTVQSHLYRVCVQQRDEDHAARLGLASGRIPGGRYLRLRLRGEPPALYQRIAPAAGRLEAASPRDGTRPIIEHYRRRDEIDVLTPVVLGGQPLEVDCTPVCIAHHCAGDRRTAKQTFRRTKQ